LTGTAVTLRNPEPRDVADPFRSRLWPRDRAYVRSGPQRFGYGPRFITAYRVYSRAMAWCHCKTPA